MTLEENIKSCAASGMFADEDMHERKCCTLVMPNGHYVFRCIYQGSIDKFYFMNHEGKVQEFKYYECKKGEKKNENSSKF